MSEITSKQELLTEATRIEAKYKNVQRHLKNLEAKAARIHLEIEKTRIVLRRYKAKKQTAKSETNSREVKEDLKVLENIALQLDPELSFRI